MSQSSAIVGAVYSHARSFTISTSSSVSAEKTIAIGGYYLLATDADCWVEIGATGSTATDGSAVTTQPAAASYNGMFYVPAGVPVPLDVTDSNQVITAITESGTGKLRVIGPITQTARR
jgi:hypothetical protein